METMRWEDNKLVLIDQTKIPQEISYVTCRTYQDVAEAIKKMVVRGAPAIGAAAGFGMALAARRFDGNDLEQFREFLACAAEELKLTRPTAVNLFWALDRVKRVIDSCSDFRKLPEEILNEAWAILQEDIEINKMIGKFGSKLVPQNARILTHCNAGALATGGYGTALGIVRTAHKEGKEIQVYADETRPLLQGARLTAFELMEDGIPVTLITDNMAGYAMKKGLIDLIIVGADRVTACGDVANKIGTYGVAVLAKAHGIPFYVAAPVSTFDLSLSSGDEIPIEERDAQEVREIYGYPTAPAGVPVINPAFDVTPHQLITAIITEKGIIHSPNEANVHLSLS
ncbi:MAG: S-methyl-5-thioribose-1-phosphate isomerase [Desulfitobacteriaceae bacterium]|nr:S-methyl-5-thioribose-1-phosphate isomerase [Desulfitobacteriaceae bacterium]